MPIDELIDPDVQLVGRLFLKPTVTTRTTFSSFKGSPPPVDAPQLKTHRTERVRGICVDADVCVGPTKRESAACLLFAVDVVCAGLLASKKFNHFFFSSRGGQISRVSGEYFSAHRLWGKRDAPSAQQNTETEINAPDSTHHG